MPAGQSGSESVCIDHSRCRQRIAHDGMASPSRIHCEPSRTFVPSFPQPEVNVRLAGFELDFLWPANRLVVELDGWDSHRTRSAFEEDRARDARLTLLGYEVVR